MRFENSFISIAVLLITFSCNSTKKSESKEKTPKQKPNIIYILADDLGYGEVGVYGQTKIETPNIDALAKEGMMFTQYYSGAPVCAPARSVLMTGKHLGHSFVRGNDEWADRGDVWNYKSVIADASLEGQRPLPSETVTIPKLLKQSGYKTGMVGKWGLGAPQTESIPTKMGFDYFFGYNCQRQAHTYNPVHLYENGKRYSLKENDTIAPGTGINKDADPLDEATYAKYNQPIYSSEIAFEKLMGFVKENKDELFFLYWASPIPHLPLQAPKKWVDYYVKKFGDEKPYFFREGERGSYFPARYPHATYAAMVSYLDENIGKLVDYLKKEGLYENTLIVFTSDNGPSYTGGTDSPWFNSGGPFSSVYGKGKGYLHEGGIRIPMIASWPNKIKASSKTDHISAFWDVLPTFCDIADSKAPNDIDGISFYNTLTKEGKQKEHEYLYWEYPEYGGQAAVRIGKWKILWKEIKKGNKKVELFNLDEDIREENNIADKYPEITNRLFEIIKKEHSTPETKRFRMNAIEEVYNTK